MCDKQRACQSEDLGKDMKNGCLHGVDMKGNTDDARKSSRSTAQDRKEEVESTRAVASADGCVVRKGSLNATLNPRPKCSCKSAVQGMLLLERPGER